MMKNQDEQPANAAELRRQAEQLALEILAQSSANMEAQSPEETRRTIHELRVHQIEVELQNEELRRAQVKLDAAQARYFDLYDLAPVAYVTLSEHGLLLEVNLATATLLGVIRGELIKRPFFLFILPEDRGIYHRHNQKLFETGEPQSWEMRLLKQAVPATAHVCRHYSWVTMEAVMSQDADGAPVCRVVISDITERKQAAEALRESEARFERLAEQCGTIIWEEDAQGLYTYVSDMSVSVLGYRPEELVGRVHFYDLYPESEREAFKKAFAVFDSKGVFQNLVTVVQTKDGRKVWLLTSGIPFLNADGTLRGYWGTATDITAITQAKEQLGESNRQLEASVVSARELAVQALAASAAKGRFLANMSHEIRTPLNAVLGFSQLLQHDPKLASDHQPWVATINRSGNHLLALLNEILEFSKLEAGNQDLVSSRFDLPALLRDLETTFRPQTDAKQLTLRLDGLDEVERYLVGHKGKLRQILLNLLGNAVKFTAAGGVWVRASTAPLGTGGLRLVVLVGDSGPGIGAEEIGRLFAPFEQGEAGVRSCSGTGLGLAISRQLARLMGGDVTVSSEPGRGSVFRLEILAQPATDSMLEVMFEGAHVRPGQGEVDARAAEPDRTLVEQPQALIQERLDSLPAALRNQLREAALCGRREQLRQTLQQVADPELRGQLLNLAAKFDYEPFL